MALTDHDTVAGIPEAVDAGERLGVRVISGCEFSTAAPWGEMHVLGYFLPHHHDGLETFLQRCRDDRVRRGRAMVEGLQAWGVDVSFEDLVRETGGAAMGRPHLARALVRLGKVLTVDDAFQQWLARGRPAYVEKRLPTFREVADLAHQAGGLISAAHLRDRANRATLTGLKEQGLDAVEVRHPGHSDEMRRRIGELAGELGLAVTGGSDWHGDDDPESSHAMIGSQEVPGAWLDALEERVTSR